MNSNNEQTANLRHVFVYLTNKSKRFESRGTHQMRLYTQTLHFLCLTQNAQFCPNNRGMQKTPRGMQIC